MWSRSGIGIKIRSGATEAMGRIFSTFYRGGIGPICENVKGSMAKLDVALYLKKSQGPQYAIKYFYLAKGTFVTHAEFSFEYHDLSLF